MRRAESVLLIFLMTLPLFAATARKKPRSIAPPALAHPTALFLSELSAEGSRQVTFKALAVGTRFFFEEQSGVTVYRFVDGQYVREAFHAGLRLPSVLKRYSQH